jgi:hypothetical protein
VHAYTQNPKAATLDIDNNAACFFKHIPKDGIVCFESTVMTGWFLAATGDRVHLVETGTHDVNTHFILRTNCA